MRVAEVQGTRVMVAIESPPAGPSELRSPPGDPGTAQPKEHR